jgi:4-amino-4-deoxy-L-arabinose transferase-like glycosyltransferase
VPAVLTLGFLFLVLLVYARSVIAFPFDYDQGEGFELYDAIRLARGENIYLDNAVFPYYASNYPPVYRVLVTPLIWLFGPQLWTGRVVAFAATLGIAVLIGWVSFRLLRAQALPNALPIAVLCGLAFLAANHVYHVAPLARAHLPMVFFAVAGIICIERGLRDTPHPGWAAAGVTLLMVAGFTKLQAVDAMAAGFGYLLFRHPRWCIQALLGCALATGVLLLWIDTVSAGQFWLNVVAANVNEYDIAVTWQTYGQWFQLQAVLNTAAIAHVIWDVARAIRTRSFKPITIWSMYFVAGTVMGMLTGKWGAGPTYLVAAIAASCVCAASLIARLAAQMPSRTFALSTVVGLAFTLQAVLNWHTPTSGRFFGAVAQLTGVAARPGSYPPYPYFDTAGYVQLGHLLDTQDTLNGWALVEEIKKHPGPVWSEEAMLTLHAGKDVVTNPTQLLNLSKNNALDMRAMIADIDQRRFGAVIYRAFFYPEEVKQAIARNYDFVGSIRINGFEYYLLLPKKPA